MPTSATIDKNFFQGFITSQTYSQDEQ